MFEGSSEDIPDIAGGFGGFAEQQTPAVVINGAALTRNLNRMQALANASGVALHPHIKTHKSFTLARRQLDAGAAGVTASRPLEAMGFLGAGIGPVTIAYPIVDPQVVATLLRQGANHKVGLRFIVDSEIGLDALGAARRQTGLPVSAFIKVDVGLHRCGVDPRSAAAITLAQRMAVTDIDLFGLLSHAGHAYGAGDPEAIVDIARDELAILAGIRHRLEAHGVAAPRLSIGSTPTVLANAGFDGVDEIRPGNYVFLDLTARRLGLAERSDLALGVAATVVAANAEFSIIDAGSKTLSSDLGPHGVHGFGEVWMVDRDSPLDLVKLSEEHGFVRNEHGPLPIGSKVLVLPNHACPVVNLARNLLLLGAQPETLTVDA
jgi:D-serine deaminase-like pyridoxal phosphate-dependent protein